FLLSFRKLVVGGLRGPRGKLLGLSPRLNELGQSNRGRDSRLSHAVPWGQVWMAHWISRRGGNRRCWRDRLALGQPRNCAVAFAGHFFLRAGKTRITIGPKVSSGLVSQRKMKSKEQGVASICYRC